MSTPGGTVVLYSDAEYVGGAESVLRHIICGLDDDLRPVVIGSCPEVVQSVADARPGTERYVTPPIRTRTDFGSMRTLRRVLAAVDPLVVHMNLTDMGSCLGAIATTASLRRPGIVVVEHNALAPYSRGQRAAKVLSVRMIDAHVAVSAWLADIVAATSMERRSKIDVIHNGVAPASPRALTDRTPVRLGVVSRLDHAKGVDVVLRALVDVPGAVLVVAGDGPERGALEALARELHVDDRVEFRGWLATEECFDDLDAFVLGSRNEALSMSMLEAMQRGLPVVATDVGGLGEAVVDGVNGLLVPVGDAPALAHALRRLVGDGDLRRRLGAAGLERARREFTAEAMARSYVALYRRIAAARAPRTRSR